MQAPRQNGRRWAARARLIGQRSAMDPDTGVLPGPGFSSNEPRRPYSSRRSAANPASHRSLPRRAAPRDCSPAASRLVTGLSRVNCRDASGLAVLMGTGRRAGLPGVSRLAAPAAPVARLLRSPARAGRPASSPAGRYAAHARHAAGAGGLRRATSPPAAGVAGGRLAAGSRAGGQVAAAGRAGLPTVWRCRSAWA